MSDCVRNTDEVIAKEITIAVISSIELGKCMDTEDIPPYVSNLYKTILKAVKNPD